MKPAPPADRCGPSHFMDDHDGMELDRSNPAPGAGADQPGLRGAAGLWPVPAACGGPGALADVHRAALRAHRAGPAHRPGQRPQRQGLVADAVGPGGPDGGALPALAALTAVFGATVAARQSWLQWYPPQSVSCGRDFYGMIERFPLSRAIPMILR